LSFKNRKFGAGNATFSGNYLKTIIEILSNRVSSVGKLQLPVAATFLTHDAAGNK